MNKFFDEKGNLTEWARRVMLDLTYGLEQLMASDDVCNMTESELRNLGSHLAAMMGNAVSNKISRKLQKQTVFDAMSDDEFYAYLKEKYGNLWQVLTLTEEELRRVKPISHEKIEELLKKGAEKIGHPPCNGVRFPRKCSKTY